MQTLSTLTVSELNGAAKELLETQLGAILVQGEISNFSIPSSGHWYFSLKDDKAQVRCAMFRGSNRFCTLAPASGFAVLAQAQVSLYEPRGEFQLIITQLEELGAGLLRRQLEELQKKLLAEGLFDIRHKKPLPDLPSTIGIVTSSTGAALQDILQVLKRRSFGARIVIYPTPVQGAEAPGQIVKALQVANARQECDVLILARGGGSHEDLMAFNHESVVRAIFVSTIPIISGIGHETDLTLADWVADVRAPTPSAAAEMVSESHRAALLHFANFQKRLWRTLPAQLSLWQQHLARMALQLKHPQKQLLQWTQQLDLLEHRLKQVYSKQLHHYQRKLWHYTAQLNCHHPLPKLANQKQQALSLKKQLLQSAHQFMLQQNTKIRAFASRLHTLSPLATLDRGYAIARQEGRILTSALDVDLESSIEVLLSKGKLWCAASKVELTT